MRLDPVLISDRGTLAYEANKDGKIRFTHSSLHDGLTLLPDQALVVVNRADRQFSSSATGLRPKSMKSEGLEGSRLSVRRNAFMDLGETSYAFSKRVAPLVEEHPAHG